MSGATKSDSLRVGLVLGGGGIQGTAWLEGALAGLAAETGWSPADAEVLVGTSAGAWVATLLAAGVPPWLMSAQSAGDTIEGLIPGATPPPPPPDARSRVQYLRGPGSPALVARAVLRPRASSPMRAVFGLMPRGRRFSSAEDLVRLVVPEGWPSHPNLWCAACDYRTGERVVFTSRNGPADVARAVAASCAVPGYYSPVRIAGRYYIDGGIHSVSNLDLVANRDLDLVICLNPLSSLEASATRSPTDLLTNGLRRFYSRKLAAEARLVRRGGTEVLLIQPTGRDLAVLGSNWLRAARHREIVSLAHQTVAEQLRASPLANLLRQLPPGPEHMLRRPDGPTATWPPLVGPPAWSA
jgi:NTE family protein